MTILGSIMLIKWFVWLQVRIFQVRNGYVTNWLNKLNIQNWLLRIPLWLRWFASTKEDPIWQESFSIIRSKWDEIFLNKKNQRWPRKSNAKVNVTRQNITEFVTLPREPRQFIFHCFFREDVWFWIPKAKIILFHGRYYFYFFCTNYLRSHVHVNKLVHFQQLANMSKSIYYHLDSLTYVSIAQRYMVQF